MKKIGFSASREAPERYGGRPLDNGLSCRQLKQQFWRRCDTKIRLSFR